MDEEGKWGRPALKVECPLILKSVHPGPNDTAGQSI